MSNYILFDDTTRRDLLPLTYTRPIADLRIGILTIRQKWEQALNQPTSILTAPYLQTLFPMNWDKDNSNVYINSSVLPNKQLLEQINNLPENEIIIDEEIIIAAKSIRSHPHILHRSTNEQVPLVSSFPSQAPKAPYRKINNLWDIFIYNAEAIQHDFEVLTYNRTSENLSATNTIINRNNIFVEEGASIQGAFLNAEGGPIYIGKEATVMEGSLIRGPFALCEHGQVKMGAKIYGATTIGPYSKIGGEVSNSVIWGYSNKGHDGFLGNSVLGAWCNLGADTNTSNLKNNYSEVQIWNYPQGDFMPTGQQFCGLMMGDHSKSGINTMFNTGTVVGVASNIFGSGFPSKFIPSFAWGGSEGFTTHKIDKAIETAKRVYERRGLLFSKLEEEVLKTIFEETTLHRKEL
ncbi:MAG: GlmU family protein [Chitinophagales bacterium]